MKFDDVLYHVGEFGRYQRFIFVLVASIVIYTGMINLSTVITTYIPDHRCALVNWPNDTYKIQNSLHEMEYNISEHFLTNLSVPSSTPSCLAYDGNQSLQTCERWVYDKSDVMRSAVTQYNLICGKKMWRGHLRVTYLCGQFVAGIIFGPLSDRFGRRYSLISAIAVQLLAGSVIAASQSVYMFAVFNFLSGFGNNGSYMLAYGLCMEMVGKSKRFHAGVLTTYGYSVGVIICAFLAYLLRDWRYFQLSIALPGLAFVALFWVLPESPRWLINRKRNSEAVFILKKIATVNKVKVEEGVLCSINTDMNDNTVPFSEIFRMWRFVLIVVILLFNWIVCSLTYYGLSLNSGDLGGSVQLNLFLTGVMEFIAYILVHLFINRRGRKFMFISTMTAGGIPCLLTIFTILYLSADYQAVTLVLAMIGKLGVTAAFCVVYIHTVEIFPTVIRTSGLGMCTCISRVGSIISPYIADLGLLIGGGIGKAVPLIIFGSFAVLSGVVSVYLPETLNYHLPDTFDDLRDRYRTKQAKEKADQLMSEDIPLTNESHPL